jgi:hypothetical protein
MRSYFHATKVAADSDRRDAGDDDALGEVGADFGAGGEFELVFEVPHGARAGRVERAVDHVGEVVAVADAVLGEVEQVRSSWRRVDAQIANELMDSLAFVDRHHRRDT